MKKFIKPFLLLLTQAATSLILLDVFDGELVFSAFVGAAVCGNVFVAIGVYLVTSALKGGTRVLVAAVASAAFLLNWAIHKLIKRKTSRFTLALVCLVANVFYVLFDLVGEFDVYYRLLYTAVGVAFAFVCTFVFNCVFSRGLRYKPAPDEKVCLALFCFAVCYGLCPLTVGGYSVLFFLAPALVLFLAACFSELTAFAFAVACGLGSAVYFSDWAMLALFVLFASVGCSAMSVHRILAAVCVVACDVLFKFFCDSAATFSFMSLVPTVVGALVFVLFPQKWINYISDRVGYGKQKFSSRGVVNKLRRTLSCKLFDLSDVFFSMQSAFKTMANSTVPPEKAKIVLAKQAQQEVCVDCENRIACQRGEEGLENNLADLVTVAMSRGKISILDADPVLVSKCRKINGIMSSVNRNTAGYLNYFNKSSQVDVSRLLVCEQLDGISRIMRQLATECKKDVSFDNEKEKLLMEELTFYNVLVKETVLLSDGDSLSALATVAKSACDGETIAKITSSVVGCKMGVDKIESVSDVWCCVYMSPVPRYEIACGVATAPKCGNAISGDTHSFSRVGGGKFMLSVCDGMGSGSKAQTVSSTCISLVENFYKAGFDNDIILSSVNKLMSVAQSEAFSAVDICVINLYKGLCDFIKLGASVGFCKVNGKTVVVQGSSLPLGVLEEMKPSVTKTVLNHNDFVVICSDGFVDCFSSPDEIAALLQDNRFTNPQLVADEMLKAALKKCSDSPKDDVTVLAARVV